MSTVQSNTHQSRHPTQVDFRDEGKRRFASNIKSNLTNRAGSIAIKSGAKAIQSIIDSLTSWAIVWQFLRSLNNLKDLGGCPKID